MRPNAPSIASLAAALAFSAATTPALADPGHEAGRRYQAWTVETGGDPVYCIHHERVDSRIPMRVCKTKRGWISAGATVIDANEPHYARNDPHMASTH